MAAGMTFKNHLMDINWEYNELRGYWHAEVNGVTLQVQDTDGESRWSVAHGKAVHRDVSRSSTLARAHAHLYAARLVLAKEKNNRNNIAHETDAHQATAN